MLTKGNFTRDEWNHLLCLFNIRHFSSTNCSDAMAKRVQQDSGEERVTAKSRSMSLIARAPSTLSSSASKSPGKKSSAKAEKDDRTGQPDVASCARTHESRSSFSHEKPSTLFSKKKKLMIERDNPLSTFKEAKGHSNSSLETTKQNQTCRWDPDHSWTGCMIKCGEDKNDLR